MQRMYSLINCISSSCGWTANVRKDFLQLRIRSHHLPLRHFSKYVFQQALLRLVRGVFGKHVSIQVRDELSAPRASSTE